MLIIASPSLRTTNCPWKGVVIVTWPLYFLEKKPIISQKRHEMAS